MDSFLTLMFTKIEFFIIEWPASSQQPAPKANASKLFLNKNCKAKCAW